MEIKLKQISLGAMPLIKTSGTFLGFIPLVLLTNKNSLAFESSYANDKQNKHMVSVLNIHFV